MFNEIKVTVDEQGKTTTEFSGFVGVSCLEEAKRLRNLLLQFGIQAEETDFQAKPELTNAQVLEAEQRESEANEA